MSISNSEHDALLYLTKFFADRWTIIDVGSNKGEWSDVLMRARDESMHAGKYDVYLFEPNKLLLDYTRVKYDYNDRVHFVDYAAYREDFKELDFHYFTNKNSGLSSIYDNPRWDNLPKRHGQVLSLTIDTFVKTKTMANPDIVKIDVEGAEYDVMMGLRGLMSDKRVKFIQVEYSEHYKVAGYKFKDVIDLAAANGYFAHEWDGKYFKKITEFVEDYRLENFVFTYLPIERYHYTQLWNNEFKKNTANFHKKFEMVLEIGCFEGLTTNYICDNLLKDGGRMICIDPLTDEYLPGHEDNAMFVGQYDRFMRNTEGQPVELIRKKSSEVLPLIRDYRFGLIFVDGDHSEQAVYNDGVMAIQVCRLNGYILFDDYGWREETKAGIDRFLKEFAPWIKVITKEYQVLVKLISRP
jgi:FkbM family methyltransferase